ncbi:MAG: hypothetical protein H8E44_15645 [Planctomycetes bacterium]|nr:hypothetical protein [Planctomycetota bacterium]MBL7044590.1 hypothetical protein [Pirellulaceae bacterium]
MRKVVYVVIVLGLTVGARTFAADVVLENARFRAVLGEDAVWRSLVDKATNTEYCAADKKVTFGTVRVDGKTRNANRVELADDRLTVAFADCDAKLTYSVEVTDDWIAFRLVELSGTRPTHATLVRLGVTITERGGSRLNAAWNDKYSICLRGINLQSQGSCSRRSDHTLLSMTSQDAPGPKLEGAGAALIAAPTSDLRAILCRLSADYDLARNEGDGVPSHDLPIARQSYWFLSFGEKDVDTVIEYCRKAGFRQVMLSSNAWCASVGHFTFRENAYPDGIESLRRTVAKLHENGILVGMHTFASKISKMDPYVTPIPNRGFWVDRSATLAADVTADQTTIRTEDDLSQWPGSPVCKQKVWEGHVSKHQEVIIDNEIIRFESIGPEGKWDTFLGCQRGAWGTQAAAHKAQTECRHYGVDGCINGYIIDQDSPLFQKSTSRLAHVFNHCDFDMVYFDGSEDVDRRRYHYYSSNAHAVPMRKFKKRPVIHMGGGRTHGLWHSFTRYGTIDQYPGTYLAYLHAGGSIDDWPTCKDHIDRTLRRVIAGHEDMTPGELGWFGIGPKSGNYDGLQFDEIEYLMCKSLAYDSPISLQTSFSRMEAHPLTPDILEIVRQYEQLRLGYTVPAQTLQRLQEQGKDFVKLPHSLTDAGDSPEFVQVAALDKVAGTHDVRAFVGQWRGGTIATVWHYVGKQAELFVDTGDVKVYDVRGETVKTEERAAKTCVPLDQRRMLLHFPDTSPAEVRKLLTDATLEVRKPVVNWIQAEDFQSCVGSMVKGSAAGVQEPEAMGEVVLCSGRFDRIGSTPCYTEYKVDVPHKGRWTLWARVRYPTGGDMSFGLVLPDQEVTLSGNQVVGNCGVNDKKWHWTGRGGGVTTVPPGSPIVFNLEAGEFVFRIYPREGPGTAAGNPRLDCFCLTEDPDYRPSDADAKAAFK